MRENEVRSGADYQKLGFVSVYDCFGVPHADANENKMGKVS